MKFRFASGLRVHSIGRGTLIGLYGTRTETGMFVALECVFHVGAVPRPDMLFLLCYNRKRGCSNLSIIPRAKTVISIPR